MRRERTVDGDKLQSLNLTLREEQTVERVARRWLRLDRGEGVARVDRDDPDAQHFEKLGERTQSCLQSKLAQPAPDRNFP